MTGQPIGRGLALYALACVVVIGLAGGVFIAVFGAVEERKAVLASAMLALVVNAFEIPPLSDNSRPAL